MGTFGGIIEQSIRRLIAYSSITANGYYILILYLSDSSFLLYGFSFFTVYVFNICIIFIIIANSNSDSLGSLYYLKYTDYIGSTLFALSIFSIGALPIGTIFITKLNLYTFFIMDNEFIILLVFISAGIINLYVYIRLVKNMYYVQLPSTFIVYYKPFSYNIIVLMLTILFIILTTSTRSDF